MKFVGRVALAASALVLSAAAGSTVALAQTTELKIGHFLPPNHTFQKAMVAWGETLAKESGGRIKVTVYPASQLSGPPNRQIDSARNGVVDVAVALHGATPGRYATTELASLPYTGPGGTSATSAVASRRLTELAPTHLAKEHEGVRILWMAVTPPLLFHSKNPVRKVEDFKGLRVRYAGQQFQNIITALNAVPMLVPPNETQDALSKGIIDAATFPYEGASSFDIGTVAKNTTEPGVSSATFAVVMNQAKYDALPVDLKALIDSTTGPAAAEAFGKSLDEAEIDGKKSLVGKGVQVFTLPDTEVSRMKTLFAPQIDAAIAAVEKQARPGRKFYEDYTR